MGNVVSLMDKKKEQAEKEKAKQEQEQLEFKARVSFKKQNDLPIDEEIGELLRETAESFRFTDKELEMLDHAQQMRAERMKYGIHSGAPDIPIARIMYYLPYLRDTLNTDFNGMDDAITDMHKILSDDYCYLYYEKYKMIPYYADYADMSDEEFISHYKDSIQDVLDSYRSVPEKETVYQLFHLFDCLTEYGHRELMHSDEFFAQIDMEIKEKDRG